MSLWVAGTHGLQASRVTCERVAVTRSELRVGGSRRLRSPRIDARDILTESSRHKLLVFDEQHLVNRREASQTGPQLFQLSTKFGTLATLFGEFVMLGVALLPTRPALLDAYELGD